MSTRGVEPAGRFVELGAQCADPGSGIAAVGDAAADLGSALVGGLTLVAQVNRRRSSTPDSFPGARERLVHALLGAGDDGSEHRILGERLQRVSEPPFARFVYVIVETPVEHGGDRVDNAQVERRRSR